MAFLIDIVKGLVAFAAVCVGLGIMYIVFVTAREAGWLVKQENRKQYRAKQKPCDFCGPAGKYIAVVEAGGYFEHGLFFTVSGAYLQMFDEAYPGFSDSIEINYCPKCGRVLREITDKEKQEEKGK